MFLSLGNAKTGGKGRSETAEQKLKNIIPFLAFPGRLASKFKHFMSVKFLYGIFYLLSSMSVEVIGQSTLVISEGLKQ